MTARVYIDGQAGTTGLQIRDRLAGRADVCLATIPDDARKDEAVRREYLNGADLVILCLPDDAAREAVAMIDNPATRVLDASTAHRVSDDWVYGLPEMAAGQADAIRDASRVSNPGCYPTGFILMVRPLVDAGLVSRDYPFALTALSGYSGGGRQMVEAYEERRATQPADPWSARPYGFALHHKHLPEMAHYAGIAAPPVFTPHVGHFAQGLIDMVPLQLGAAGVSGDLDTIHACLEQAYAGSTFIRVLPPHPVDELDGGFLEPQACNGSNRLDIAVFGHESQALLVARFDNLGKGAAGAAIQNMNLMLGAGETTGLDAGAN